MKASELCYSFIKKNEGFSLHAYLDTGGVPTIGWGTTRYPNGFAVKMGEVCTEAEAQTYLEHEVSLDEAAVNEAVKVPLAQAEFDALVDFAYNVGTAWITGKGHVQATLIKLLNQGKYITVPGQLALFERDIHGKVIPGLVTRRKWESQMWVAGENDHSPIVALVAQNAPGDMPQTVTPSKPAEKEIPMAAPTVTVPVASSNVVINPWINSALNIVSIFGGIMASHSVDLTSVVGTLTGGNFWAGLLAAAIPQIINHFTTTVSNTATVAALSSASPNAA